MNNLMTQVETLKKRSDYLFQKYSHHVPVSVKTNHSEIIESDKRKEPVLIFPHLTNVTLACDNVKQDLAHKVILTQCSSVLESEKSCEDSLWTNLNSMKTQLDILMNMINDVRKTYCHPVPVNVQTNPPKTRESNNREEATSHQNTNVTLACGDVKQNLAHKVILTQCSHVLKNTSCKSNFTNVTLADMDCEKVSVHKIILCASSHLETNILLRNKQHQQEIYRGNQPSYMLEFLQDQYQQFQWSPKEEYHYLASSQSSCPPPLLQHLWGRGPGGYQAHHCGRNNCSQYFYSKWSGQY